jgi:serine/threonine protein phosphatase PrpC
MKDTPVEHASPALAIRVGAESEVGQREQNQDCMTGFTSPFGAVYLIADGMGGHRGGAEASRLVVEAFSRHLQAAPASTPVRDALTLALRLANIEVLEKSKSGNPDLEGMGSTVAVALFAPAAGGLDMITAHVGDSRIYLQRRGVLTQITTDHTQIQWLIDIHALDEASARNHPDASVLTRAIGHTTELEIDVSDPIPLQSGDGILLCSDGLSGFAGSEDISHTIKRSTDPSDCAHLLVQLALAAGSNDNITIQFLRIEEKQRLAAQGRARHTQPEYAPSPPRSSGFPMWLPIVAITFVVLLGVGAWWFYTHRNPAVVETLADPHTRISQLKERVQILQTNAGNLDSSAAASEQDVDKDLKDLQEIHEAANRPDYKGKIVKPRQMVDRMEQAFSQLRAGMLEIKSETQQLKKDVAEQKDKLSQLDKIGAKPMPQAELQTEVAALADSIAKSEARLKSDQALIDQVTPVRQSLENSLQIVQTDLKATKVPASKKPGKDLNPITPVHVGTTVPPVTSS